MGLFTVVFTAIAALSAVDAAELLRSPNSKDIVPNSYLVVMKDSVSSADLDSHVSWVTDLHSESITKPGVKNLDGFKHSYKINGWHAYSGSFDSETLASILDNDQVDFVEHDRYVYIDGLVTQKDAPSWGLGRVSHRMNGTRDYVYDETAGSGITFYGVDTGIDIRHPDFGGRAVWGTNVVSGTGDNDRHGHGTHTAATATGTKYGLAKKANVVAVKALNDHGAGLWSNIMKALEWCVDDARKKNALGKAVLNLSISGGKVVAANQAITNAANAGIFVSVAAGNDNQDATNKSPASAENVCCAAASTIRDEKASISNYGSVVKLYAPGQGITSATPNNSTGVMTGTSMAAPHVGGVGATLMASKHIAPSAVCAELIKMATGAVRNPGANTTNKLLYNGSGQ
ncbi:alkaline proteinase [Nannizzia gypsea CBS 118893]|uniref:Subtilisin-like protease 11 n=1 Tax=Arthroderma gypseum (strain ATCC MYA-4604 / CBS 118893) TaxID=535722 RepID=SUB11_ARTGP|nr:alkaline proteinase [Nannizzia gypsea CBS 118893]E4V5C5.1 RecName: Full=Subtilisin-like protease 11; Flags: Precursor [Nannizzia gypsea CBS 118893]EFR05199.1 alkaline proteinase [Nannizzia gypsea CBS 118893]